ncbi:hypothetical protein [Chryseobacterium potabilaquae]|uniref:Uncharacterized protein n=1 Tax=Chryseobacterium potabilaquae TaxID=2675057 RepID=A0A6N4X6H4_9FLAO|nr:hypothetical protein [Chryseobacterium potabilaquae]CAA7194462.1 hypothetical protein CHRY9293_00774 [Chryseobacterium potabilaquae]
MKRALYCLFLFTSAISFAQKNSGNQFAIANDIVGTVSLFNSKKQIIQSKNEYKTAASLPKDLKKYSYLADKGLVVYTIKNGQEGLDRLSIAQVNEINGLPKETPVYIDDYQFSDPDILVYAEILPKVAIKENNGKKYLDIKTSSK